MPDNQEIVYALLIIFLDLAYPIRRYGGHAQRPASVYIGGAVPGESL